MKLKSTIWTMVVLLIIAGILIYVYESKPQRPVFGENGEIIGKYSIESIMSLNLPYECSLVKTDGASQIAGVIQIADNKMRGDFDLTAPETNIASHLIIINNQAYTWTSLGPVGFKTPVVKSTIRNASVAEQAQIIGLKDNENYNCKPMDPNLTAFDLPANITFSALKN